MLPGLGKGVMGTDCLMDMGFYIKGAQEFLNWTIGMAAQLCEYTTNHRTVDFG